jgi:hypothetical protein
MKGTEQHLPAAAMSLPYNAIVTGTLCQSSYDMYVVHLYASLVIRGIATGPYTSPFTKTVIVSLPSALCMTQKMACRSLPQAACLSVTQTHIPATALAPG